MKIRKILALILSVMMAISVFASCADNSDDLTDTTTYVSVYAYNSSGKRFLNLDAVRVIPNENAENDWEKTATPYLALKALCESKKKDCVITTDIGKNVTVESISNFSAGTSEDGNPCLWYLYVNGEKVEDSKNCILKNYDLVEFRLEEDTYRTISITFNATDGAKKLIDEEAVSFGGDKSDLSLYNFFNMSAFNSAAKKEGKTELVAEGASVSGMEIGLSEDKTSIVKIGDSEVTETTKWVVYVNDELVTSSFAELMLKDGDTVLFDLQNIDSDAETEVPEA